jgi:hypothetical protein
LGGVLDQKPASNGRVGVEGYFELEEWKEGSFDMSRYGIVVSLKNGGEDAGGGGLDIVDFLNCGGSEV